ncbi:MAG TPA: 2-oxoacid:acceptor oxidoreductase family protein [Candidatus Copromorpha excrementigallinarum]|uniref:2-oxoacid:acceptor oxidoreductase family protein n=1 Tax=Candidatus Allocopromorpha excrementigallinarum TaxID=2840742 RepID=A0A9D1I107_9FIRM|nr:2-oxoacid:acceptor oxidoreductase family protein [Candidatus Copromorpha excrementigallinarum]
MRKEIILAGFGGQGIMSMGKNLVEAGVKENLEASWVPSYGPEMRGGTANCSVILSDKPIGAPLVETPEEVIAMNRPSLLKFEPETAPGGTVFINSSIIADKISRKDIDAVYIPCDDIAKELGNIKVSNMVMLGAYIGKTGTVKAETVKEMIRETFSGKKESLIKLNIEALDRGIRWVG